MALIYHIADQEQWEKAERAGTYRGDTLDSIGFIHCSTEDQILKVANFQYKGATGKVLLEIDEDLTNVPVEYETVPGAPFPDKFPHLYGPIEVDAVTRSAPFEPDADGTFSFPEEDAWT